MKSSIISALLGASMLVAAHPGQSKAEMKREAAERNAYLSTHKRSLAHCADQLKARGNDVAMQNRRRAMVEKARQKRSISQTAKPYLQARDLDTVLATDHKSNLTGITADTDPSILFSSNNSCILSPEVTQGPYWVSGELVRQDMSEDQAGVPMTLDIQIIDVNTCEPVPQVYLEAWHCNATGVYSGVIASGNGDSSDETNLDNTFLRGINLSDDDGIVTFDTVFPGHYTGRTTHIHVLSHVDATLNANNTLSGGNITHVGQVFFDQDLISLVETEEPYASNTQELMTNAEDSILAEEAADVDPMVEYVLLGEDVSEGVFAWIAFGMDTTASYSVNPAVYYTSEGGVENENAGSGGGSPPNGTAPSGAPPAATSA
ncbi:aromatic compound dioxygenase [Lentithecium fluviatile CBS 122367]|uniref:Aromatic compound dioxygenase n=1 Tax=Lentithecium fluviatile CBS 122367 TaxID=1168545 RepID=A0A6G1JKZ8_9PLEO|nr:aromatic compound dioxygenase [Lentithecium fluviatile CBS 122367]